MQRFQSHKFRLTATADQELHLRRIAGCCRFVFNRALALRNQRRDEGRKLMSSDELALLLVECGSARRDYLHPISTSISKSHTLVCIEDLKVSAMSKPEATRSGYVIPSARAKRGLNKSILDQAWFEFRR